MWKGYASVLVLLIQNSFCVDFFTEKPNWVKTCKLYEPGFTKCSTESSQELMNQVGNQGIPELEARIGSLDPLSINELILSDHGNQGVTLTTNLTDIRVKGFSKMFVKESKMSKKDFSWKVKIQLPKMHLEGKYKMAGRILLLPLNGNGRISLDFDNMDIISLTRMRLYEKDGFTFLNVEDVKVDLDIGKMHSYLENLFNGNSKELEKSTNEFLNNNYREVFEALRPLISEAVERILYKITKEVFALIPAKFLIDDIPSSREAYQGRKS